MTGSGRTGTGDFVYRRNRAILLAENSLCWLCGHEGAQTADHVIPHKLWPRDDRGRMLPGFNDLTNLCPAHGAMGPGRGTAHNYCPTCGRACNQIRGAGRIRRPQSRVWLAK